MTYEQVRDILTRIRSFHRRLRDELEQARPSSKDERTRYLLEVLRRDEQAMNIALGKYQRNGGANVLATWIQFVPDEDAARLLNETRFTDDLTPEEMVHRKLEVDRALAELYLQLAEQTSAAQVAELFTSLAELTNQRLTDQGWQVRDSDAAPRNAAAPKNE